MNTHVLTVNKRQTNDDEDDVGNVNDEEEPVCGDDNNFGVKRRPIPIIGADKIKINNNSPMNSGFNGGVNSSSIAVPVSSQQRVDRVTTPASGAETNKNQSHTRNHAHSHNNIYRKQKKKMRHSLSTSASPSSTTTMTTARRAVSSPLNIDEVLSQALKTKTLLRPARRPVVVPPYFGSSNSTKKMDRQTDSGCPEDDFVGRCNNEPMNNGTIKTTTEKLPFYTPFTLQALPIASAYTSSSRDRIVMKEPEVLVTTTAATNNMFLNNETKWRPFFTLNDGDTSAMKKMFPVGSGYTSGGGGGGGEGCGRPYGGERDIDGSESRSLSNDTIETTADIWLWDGTSTIIDYVSCVDDIIINDDDDEQSNGRATGDSNERWSDRPVTGISAVQKNSKDRHKKQHRHQKQQISRSVIPKEVLRRELPNIKKKTILPTINEEIASSLEVNKDAEHNITDDTSDGIDPSTSTSSVSPPPTKTTKTTTTRTEMGATTENDDDRIVRRFLRRRRSVERFWEYVGCREKLERLNEVCHPDFVAYFRGPEKQSIGQMSMFELAEWMRPAFDCSPDLKFFHSYIDQSADDPNMLVLHDFCANGTHTGAPFCMDDLPPLEARGHRWVLDECESYFYFEDDDNDDDDECPKILSFEEIAFGEYTGPFKLYHLIKKKQDEEDLERRREKYMRFAIQRHQI